MHPLLQRLRPPVQTSRCAGCGRAISERRRRPCRSCGSINRHVSASAADALSATDRAT